MTSLKDNVVLVTGASSGIGEATARELASAGAKLMLAARREDRLRDLVKDLRADGHDAEYQVTDVTVREQVMDLGQKTLERFGRVDTLFNNAGCMPLSFMKNLHLDEWDRMVDVNVKGLLYAIAAVLPNMMERKAGHIINVSSVAGHVLFPGAAVYCGTKFAVRAISEGLRREVTSLGNIRVTIISPGAVATELTDAITDEEMIEGFKQMKLEPIDPGNIARAVRYAMEQPTDVDINEILVRPTSQEL